MNEMLGLVVYMEMLQKDKRRPHEFEQLQQRTTFYKRLSQGVRRVRTRLLG